MDTAVLLRIVCAWCSKVLQEGSPGAPTSHALCLTCREFVMRPWA
jgi:hypothetical protein